MQKPKILFICTANLNRSKTAEGLFRDKYPVKSAGTLCIKDDGYTTPVGLELLEWADLVIVFESDHVECQSKTYHYQSQTGSMLA
ncbi:MAG: phosphotyrosine protein phosphatase, partial [Candidatus Nanoarchaeia archaeon]